ncbi:MAG: OadG family protein [Deltaproteobacteria bacterium]|nr:OadG family protein [Deltaproteobacteria bacterium]
MILQGLMLTVIGMGTVFCFLLLLVLLLSNLKALVDVVSRFYPETEQGRRETAESDEMSMVAAAAVIAARYAR